MAPVATGEAPAGPQASWIAIGSLAMGAFALVTSEFLPVGLLPAVARDVGSTSGQIGLMVTLPGITAAIAAPLTIHYGRRLERRLLLLILLGLLATSNVVVALSTAFAPILVGRALLGELFGWRYAFGAAAGLAAVAMIALAVLMPKVSPQASTGLNAMIALMRRGPVVTSLLAASTMYTGTYGAYTYIAPFLSEHSGISGAVLSAIFLANGVAGFLGNMAGGWISGRSPYRSVITTAVLAMGAILLLPVFGSSPTIAIGLVTLCHRFARSAISWSRFRSNGSTSFAVMLACNG